MATLSDIRRSIKAVKSTRQITKAMKMVAASKLRKAQSRMLEMRPYADKMRSVISGLAAGGDMELHPLLTVRPRRMVEVLVMTSDRGLCGAFNTNILKAAAITIAGLRSGGFEVSISIVGRKANDYFKRRNVPVRRKWAGLSGNISYPAAQEIAADMMENYINETFDELHIVYNEFKNVMSQQVTVMKLLPLAPIDVAGAAATVVDYIYEPSEQEIFNRLLPKNVEVQVFRGLLESQASEEAARMTAMENATKNANEMIDRLTLQYNKARQATITKELMDIVGGVEALK
ncbi:MAG: ATP synthase F1 subunit gamma [Thermodesulfovibrionales bacterium]|nr:ATP synthase F1 subunit gamma [Thermodesulfovibrionales bacterium]